MIPDWHPLIVHFPIALVCVAWIFQTLHWVKPTWIPAHIPLITTLLAALSGIAAAVSGEKQASSLLTSVAPELTDVILQHQAWGNTVLWGLITGSVVWVYLHLKRWHPTRLRRIIWVYLLIMMTLVFVTGYLGGELVYVHHLGLWKP